MYVDAKNEKKSNGIEHYEIKKMMYLLKLGVKGAPRLVNDNSRLGFTLNPEPETLGLRGDTRLVHDVTFEG